MKLLKFIGQLVNKSSITILFISIVFLVYVLLMKYIDHSTRSIIILIPVLALCKVIFFTFFTFRKMQALMNRLAGMSEVLLIFALLVVLMSFSFATDFSCLAEFDRQSFKGISDNTNMSSWKRLFDYFYLSVVTFTSLGYGDIVPLSIPAKLLVMMEVGLSFLLGIFGLSNIKLIQHKISNTIQ
ncbi:MAG TPA: ion transporter [Cryomorphaceae bacterium]|nr:ion transporter [Cryomorphaceae bacterium]